MRAVFLDLDDTLIEHDGLRDEAWRASIAAFTRDMPGLPPHKELSDAFFDIRHRYWRDRETVERDKQNGVNTRVAVLSQFLKAFDLYDSAAVARLLELFSEHMLRLLRLFPDTIPALETLRARGIPLIMITNGKSDVQRWKIERFGLDKYFDHILISEEVGFQKPDPRIFQRALTLAGCAPGEAWMVGDSRINDMKTPISLGIHTALRRRAEFGYIEEAAEPEVTVDSLLELLDIWFPA